MSWASPPSGQAVATRRVAPSHTPWVPLPYMERGVEHLMTHRSAGLPLKPGGRKTSITLCAFELLRRQGTVRTMLVIAPLRVCRQVWRQEAAKWTQFRHLKFGLLHGPKKDEVLRKGGCDIYLLNPEGVAWLCKQYFGRPLPFDIVTIDELTRFKNHQSERSKALRPRIDRTPWKWGLTGSLAPNGYMDVFGQQLVLDGGAALGRYITHYRDQYFQVDFNGFDYILIPGAEQRITARLAPYWMYVDENDYAQLPEQVDNPIMLDLDPSSRALYEKMKRDMLAELPDGIVTAANKAACYSKLSQMANGSVYVGDHKATVAHIHDIKLDAIEELVEELNGEPLLIGYEFNHDLDRLRERFGVVDPVTKKKVIPYLGKGTTSRQEDEWIAAWNRGELPILCAHPASAGHGLNMQGANAFNVAWFGITWDFELYDQFIRRIRRDGNKSARVFNHLLIVRGTIDELKLAALGDKDMTQNRLLKALNTQILREVAETQAGGDNPGNFVTDDRRLPMVARLSRQADAGGHQTQQPAGDARQMEIPGTAQPTGVAPKGWGKPAGGGHAPAAGAGDVQREAIQSKLAPATQEGPSPSSQAAAAFSGGVREQIGAIAEGDYGNTGAAETLPAGGAQPAPAAPSRRRRAAAPPAPTGEAAAGSGSGGGDGGGWSDPSVAIDKAASLVAASVEFAGLMQARARVLQVVFADPNETLETGLEMAREMMEFITRG